MCIDGKKTKGKPSKTRKRAASAGALADEEPLQQRNRSENWKGLRGLGLASGNDCNGDEGEDEEYRDNDDNEEEDEEDEEDDEG